MAPGCRGIRRLGRSSAPIPAGLRELARMPAAPDLYPGAPGIANHRRVPAPSLPARCREEGAQHRRQRLTLGPDIWHTSIMKAAFLPDRGVVKVAGDDARKFLNGLLTADIGKVAPASPCFAALLTPQGKIIADFIVAEAPAADGGGFLLDCPRPLAAGLVERLKFYKLRAKVTVEDVSADLGVMAIWDGIAAPPSGLCYRDPRLPDLGLRCMLAPDRVDQVLAGIGAEPADYEAHRIALGVPSGGPDFAYGDAFPHEADMDQLHGVDFDKGCFVGQEVVSRMEHRGTARTRVVPVAVAGAVAPGVAVTANGKPVGVMGSSAAGRALAALRLDRVDEALAAGAPLMAGEIALRLIKPDWARFAFPGDPKAAS
jgi:tRNA-modifying protein YgfZ